MKKSVKTLILACAVMVMAAATLAFSACSGGGADKEHDRRAAGSHGLYRRGGLRKF